MKYIKTLINYTSNETFMKITLPLVSPAFDDVNRLSLEVQKDFIEGCQIYIYKDE